MNTPQKFRKLPVVIEAVQWDGTEAEATAIRRWVEAGGGDAWFDRVALSASRYNTEWDHRFIIDTLEGQMIAKPGDWIIRGIQNEHYSCKPDVFAKTYEVES